MGTPAAKLLTLTLLASLASPCVAFPRAVHALLAWLQPPPPPVSSAQVHTHRSELLEPAGHTRPELVLSALPASYVDIAAVPPFWSWSSEFGGPNYLTRALNQHWAHAALSALGDRIKIARRGQGQDIELSVQFLLNCGADIAGSCHGGSFTGTYEFITRTGFVPFDTCLAYEACSIESTEGACGTSGRDYSCTPMNVCRTCSTFAANGGFCAPIKTFPNATVAEYGHLWDESAMRAEIFARGPIACSLNAEPLHTYTGGVLHSDESRQLNHAVSVYGWGVDPTDGPHWLVRNSWGQYWGEGGNFRIERGNNTLGIESHCAWATPGAWTDSNVPCYEDGANCAGDVAHYPEPAVTGILHGALAQELMQARAEL